MHTSVTRIDYAFSQDSVTHISAPDLGLSQLNSYPSPFIYWAEVSKHLRLLTHRAAEKGRPISALVLLGESAGMPEFKKVLKDALSEKWKQEPEAELKGDGETQGDTDIQESMQIENVVDPLWAAARGAAMYARLRQEVPWNCQELETCKNGLTNVSGKVTRWFLTNKTLWYWLT